MGLAGEIQGKNATILASRSDNEKDTGELKKTNKREKNHRLLYHSIFRSNYMILREI